MGSVFDNLRFRDLQPEHPTPEEQVQRARYRRVEDLERVMLILSQLSSKHETAGDVAKFQALEEACGEVRKYIRNLPT